ncbi:hypothetical protein E2C01_037959 [Portunus trituberculatus]|uniref:Uncharacterized protein n=1 Tax=Portunus trituberculatus TaxID=210409 RepID=A0A5B7FH88_PORTR|nr:hypothetical protein [Portunus trituberculatus]
MHVPLLTGVMKEVICCNTDMCNSGSSRGMVEWIIRAGIATSHGNATSEIGRRSTLFSGRVCGRTAFPACIALPKPFPATRRRYQLPPRNAIASPSPYPRQMKARPRHQPVE